MIETEYQEWVENKDGSITITLPPIVAHNLAETLSKWDALSEENLRILSRYPNWKRSPILRENRRESIVYGNCFTTIVCYLGRKQMNAWIKKCKEGNP